jgi:hypothetical protein
LVAVACIDLYTVIKDLIITDLELNKKVIYHLLRSITILFLIIINRKRTVLKVVTDNKGVCFYGLLIKIYANWHEVTSIEIPTKGIYYFKKLRKFFKVSTKNGTFYVPFYMKEKDKVYPKLLTTGKASVRGKWVDEKGALKELTIENCPLYIEMQKHLGGRARAISS